MWISVQSFLWRGNERVSGQCRWFPSILILEKKMELRDSRRKPFLLISSGWSRRMTAATGATAWSGSGPTQLFSINKLTSFSSANPPGSVYTRIVVLKWMQLLIGLKARLKLQKPRSATREIMRPGLTLTRFGHRAPNSNSTSNAPGL